jgi:HEAT repeat protein
MFMSPKTEISQRLRALDLSGVTFSAAIDAKGRFSPVGSLDAKLLALFNRLEEEARLGGPQIAVVAENQLGIRDGLLAPDAWPLRVIKAGSLEEAIERLYEEDGPRAAIRNHEVQTSASLYLLDRTVPLPDLYQSLPLLNEVKRERLPRKSPPGERRMEASSPEDDLEEPTSGLRLADMMRWEEEIRHEEVRYEPHEPQKVFDNFRGVVPQAKSEVPRFVVLGPPGSGKTTLVQFISHQFATGVWTWLGRRLLPVRVRLRDWETWADKVAESALPEFLAHQYQYLSPRADAHRFRCWLEHGDVLLLLDGLDEIDGKKGFPENLKATLTTFAACPTVLTCRSVSYERHQVVCPKFPVFILSGLADEQRNAYIHAYPAKYANHLDRDELIRQLDQLPTMRPLTANPLLLSIICFVVDDPEGVELPATRGELYDRAVERLLIYYHQNKRVEVIYPSEAPEVHEKRVILEWAALSLFAGSAEKLTFSGEQLGKCLQEALGTLGYGQATAPWANALRKDLVSNSGLLRADKDEQYFFLHLTIEEFLAACALARIINDLEGQGWDTPLRLDGRQRMVREWIDRKAWDPRWQEVICLLAGRLRDPALLLSMLADPNPTPTNPHGDDYFHHRLALAALCMPEIPERIRGLASCQGLVDQITTNAFGFWWQRKDTVEAIPHLLRALPALAFVNGRVPADCHPYHWKNTTYGNIDVMKFSMPLLERLAELLCDKDRNIQDSVAEAISVLGTSAVTPLIADHLNNCLYDIDPLVRSWTVRAIGKMGVAVTTPLMLERLAELLCNTHWDVRRSAAKSISKLGGAAATPPILKRLAELLYDTDGDVRCAAAQAISGLGPSAATPTILERLTELLRDKHRDGPWEAYKVREPAAEALRNLGAVAATPPILKRLTELLSDADVRRWAVDVIGRLGAAAATPVIIERLIELLCEPVYQDVSWSAARAIEGLGAVVATPQIMDRLTQLLRDADRHVLSKVVDLIGGLGAAAATPQILERLVELLCDENVWVRCSAVKAIGRLGASASTPQILEKLTELLRDDTHQEVRCSAIFAMGELGVTAFMPQILEFLAESACDADSSMRSSAAKAVGRLGTSAATLPILERLAELLRDTDGDVRCAAAQAISGLGPSAVTPSILEYLGDLLSDANEYMSSAYMYSSIIKAIGNLRAAAASPPILKRLIELQCGVHDYVKHSASKAIELLLGTQFRIFPISPDRSYDRQWRILKVEDLSC